MSYRALIVDDEQISRRIIHTFLRDEPAVEVVGEAANGTEAVLQILQLRPDLVFLDVQMPELDGFEVLREVWPHHQPFVVFTTAYDAYALRAFEVSATDYLLKPFDRLRFQQAVERVKQALAPRRAAAPRPALPPLLAAVGPPPGFLQRLLVKEQRRLFFVKTADILYFEADRNYLRVHTATGTHLIYQSLTQLEPQLAPLDFTRISRSCIVGLNHIAELETYFNGEYLVKLHNGETLKWTRSYRDNLSAFHGAPG
ncbi:LytTR family DNA-binding domain-containing protein [Hymenobacter sp. BT770]|uniref:LytR/AlgR family response regulator transcription factor n=1 Tax=Hymenobacter sp. BT770 TaxID=2886942 RepID=UPI001D0F801F|nr:LytTR family DNA-binding domain-containing protein [Hymenobacter sp. BT770]MCC3153208.1 LytTR family DNA-binding domain-containing protein [Hymenobacter sp. BT770]MDO3415318.1 LytTR family DNA-binding domain-containing protein [Hymenobacter sp. BT770]